MYDIYDFEIKHTNIKAIDEGLDIPSQLAYLVWSYNLLIWSHNFDTSYINIPCLFRYRLYKLSLNNWEVHLYKEHFKLL